MATKSYQFRPVLTMWSSISRIAITLLCVKKLIRDTSLARTRGEQRQAVMNCNKLYSWVIGGYGLNVHVVQRWTHRPLMRKDLDIVWHWVFCGMHRHQGRHHIFCLFSI